MAARDLRAIDAPGVSAALARERQKGWGVFVGGVLLFAAFTVGATVVEGRAEELEQNGGRVQGQVLSYSPGTRLFAENVDVEFIFDERRRTERVQLDDSSPVYEVGQSVVVLVDPLDPNRLTLEGEINQSQWTVWLMIFALLAGLVGIIAGLSVLFRVRRQRRLLSVTSWRLLRIRYLEVPSGNSTRGLLRVIDGGDHVLSLVSTARWNLGRQGLRGAEEAQVAGELPGYVVIRANDTGRLVSARTPRTARAERRWRNRFTEGP